MLKWKSLSFIWQTSILSATGRNLKKILMFTAFKYYWLLLTAHKVKGQRKIEIQFLELSYSILNLTFHKYWYIFKCSFSQGSPLSSHNMKQSHQCREFFIPNKCCQRMELCCDCLYQALCQRKTAGFAFLYRFYTLYSHYMAPKFWNYFSFQ